MASTSRNAQKELQQAHTAVDVKELVSSVETKLQRTSDQDKAREESPPTIHRVRPGIRGDDPGAYDPQIVSLGPFHHGKGGLEEMEQLKRAFMNDLLQRSPSNTVAKYADVVRDCAQRAREQYSGDITLQPNEFLEMLVLDGCFVVEYLVKRGMGLESELASTNCSTTLLRNDALLIENQIPFFVVEAVFKASTINWGISDSRSAPTLTELAAYFLNIKINPQAVPAPGPHHLLHLYHLTSLNPEFSPDPPRSSVSISFRTPINLVRLLYCITMYVVSMCQSRPIRRFPRMIPRAAKLQESGIIIRRLHFDNRKPCFLDIKFQRGVLKMPFLEVDSSTNSMLRNLVAYEQCCRSVGNYVTSYAVFMSGITKTAADVEVLRSCGVLESDTMSDEEVARMFKCLRKGAVPPHYILTYLLSLFNMGLF